MVALAQGDLGGQTLDMTAIFGLANELKQGVFAEYSPSFQQLVKCENALDEWNRELKIVNSLKTVVGLVSEKVTSCEVNDNPELLEIVSALLLNRVTVGKRLKCDLLTSCNLTREYRRTVNNKFNALEEAILSLNEDVLDLRHKLLHLKGDVGRFRPSARNVAKAIKVSNTVLGMDANEIEFI